LTDVVIIDVMNLFFSILILMKNIPPFANHWLDCIDIWYEAILGQGDSNLNK